MEQKKIEVMEEMIDFLTKEIDALNEKVKLYAAVIQIAAKYARQNVPGEMPLDSDYIHALVNGANDPDGTRYLQIWITKAKQMIKEKEEKSNG